MDGCMCADCGVAHHLSGDAKALKFGGDFEAEFNGDIARLFSREYFDSGTRLPAQRRSAHGFKHVVINLGWDAEAQRALGLRQGHCFGFRHDDCGFIHRWFGCVIYPNDSLQDAPSCSWL